MKIADRPRRDSRKPDEGPRGPKSTLLHLLRRARDFEVHSNKDHEDPRRDESTDAPPDTGGPLMSTSEMSDTDGRIQSGRLAGRTLTAAILIVAIPVLFQQSMAATVGLFDKILAGSLPNSVVDPALDAIGIGGAADLRLAVDEVGRVVAPGGVVVAVSRALEPDELLRPFAGDGGWEVLRDGGLHICESGEVSTDLAAGLYAWRRRRT